MPAKFPPLVLIWRYPAGNHAAAERFQYASAPVQEGFNWMSGTDRFTWHDAGAVQTPAGRFDRCWQRAAQSGAYIIILCRGVGLVVAESTTANYRLELAAKTLKPRLGVSRRTPSSSSRNR